MAPQTHNPLHRSHKQNTFTSIVSDPELGITDDEPRTIPANEIQVAVEIRYEFKRVLEIRSQQECRRKSKIIEQRIEEREAKCEALSLGELGGLGKCFEIVSAGLSKIGVLRAKHKGIAKKIVNVARTTEFAIPKFEEGEGERVVVLVGGVIRVKISRTKCQWLCDVCLKERERKQEIGSMLRRNRNHDDDGDDDDDDDDDDDGEKCPICLEEFGGGRREREVVRVPCGWLHKFHTKCIFTWLMKSSTRPLCRFHLPI